ncbi:MAG: glycosyltransferase [Clostridiales Family XIII bacterium]|jgi:glycosyltransferase involved in cell wall biosynthesis|nr:glycosyltransferase [Clostridiales Family XIII bacterium]
MPKVSVIIPVYNTERYLERCLDSVVGQTMEDMEILLVNDGSTDGSERILLACLAGHPDKIVYLKKENGGLSSARNCGMRRATGEYIAFVDSDDFVERDMFELLYAAAKETDSDVAECDFDWVWPQRSVTDGAADYADTADIFLRGRVMACNKLYRRRIVEEAGVCFPEGLQYEDIAFFYTLLPHINGVASVHRVGYHYVQREDSIINRQTERTRDVFAVLGHIADHYRDNAYFGAPGTYGSGVEYLYVRFLLGSSFLRMVRIGDAKVRRDCLRDSWNLLSEAFPAWRKNAILNTRKTGKNRYFKTVCRFTFRLYAALFRLKLLLFKG